MEGEIKQTALSQKARSFIWHTTNQLFTEVKTWDDNDQFYLNK